MLIIAPFVNMKEGGEAVIARLPNPLNYNYLLPVDFGVLHPPLPLLALTPLPLPSRFGLFFAILTKCFSCFSKLFH